jgi:predicted NUDIX family phosphoesterase/dephospho-CoA kinase
MFFRDVHRNGVLTFQDRMKAEADDGLKQLVCYVMVTRRKEVLAFRRGIHNRADAMLRGALCIGFGGHVRKQDFNLFSGETLGCLDAASREIEEELKLPEQDLARLKSHVGLQMMGLLNDDSSSIGRRHLAVVMKYEVGDDEAWSQPLRGERSVNQLHWISVEAAKLNLKDFEYWSQLCLSHFYEPMVEAQPSYAIRRKAPFRPPHILCVVGAIGSGKTETTAVLRNDLDYIEVNSGRVLAGLIEEVLTDEARREPFQKKANEFIRQDQGPAQLARAIMEAVNATGSDRVLVDGIRHRSTLDALRNAAGRRRVGVLYVHTPPNIAYRFYRQRSGSSTFLDFLRVREAEVEREVESLIADADAVLYNWTGKDIYRATVTRLMMDAWGEVNASH